MLKVSDSFKFKILASLYGIESYDTDCYLMKKMSCKYTK